MDEIRNINEKIVYKGWKVVKRVTFEYKNIDGSWRSDKKEVYVRGDAATILLYNKKKKTVIVTRQLRIPTFLNGNPEGMLIEACAGMLDGRNPEDCILAEIQEETGYIINNVVKVFEGYTSPGAITEIMHFFLGEYSDELKVNEGGGLEEENEKIEVVEIPFESLIKMVYSNEIKDVKTITLALHLKLQGIL